MREGTPDDGFQADFAGNMMASRPLAREDAEQIAVAALGFIATDGALLPRFLAITGIEAGAIRAAAEEPGFLAGVLHFVAAHEPTLLAFSAHAGIDPPSVVEAMRALPRGDDRYEAST